MPSSKPLSSSQECFSPISSLVIIFNTIFDTQVRRLIVLSPHALELPTSFQLDLQSSHEIIWQFAISIMSLNISHNSCFLFAPKAFNSSTSIPMTLSAFPFFSSNSLLRTLSNSGLLHLRLLPALN